MMWGLEPDRVPVAYSGNKEGIVNCRQKHKLTASQPERDKKQMTRAIAPHVDGLTFPTTAFRAGKHLFLRRDRLMAKDTTREGPEAQAVGILACFAFRQPCLLCTLPCRPGWTKGSEAGMAKHFHSLRTLSTSSKESQLVLG